MKHRSAFLAAFGFAGRGIWQALRSQRNLRVHVSVGLFVSGLAWLLNFTRIDWAFAIVAMALVLGLELVNSALEAVVDLASPDYHRLAREAKDTAAGAVLIAALASVAIGLLIYGTRLQHLPQYFMVRWRENPIFLIIWCVALSLCYVLLWGLVPDRHQSEGGQNRSGGTP